MLLNGALTPPPTLLTHVLWSQKRHTCDSAIAGGRTVRRACRRLDCFSMVPSHCLTYHKSCSVFYTPAESRLLPGCDSDPYRDPTFRRACRGLEHCRRHVQVHLECMEGGSLARWW